MVGLVIFWAVVIGVVLAAIAWFDFAGGDFQQFAPRRMTVLLNHHNLSVIKKWQTTRAPRMAHDFADNLATVFFSQPVALDPEDHAFEDVL